jgi:hypothetical protein
MTDFKDQLESVAGALVQKDRETSFKRIRERLKVPQDKILETFVEERIDTLYPEISRISNYIEESFLLKKEDYDLFGEFLYLLQVDIFIKNPTVTKFYALNFNRHPRVLESRLETKIDSSFLNTTIYKTYRTQQATIRSLRVEKPTYKATYNRKSN